MRLIRPSQFTKEQADHRGLSQTIWIASIASVFAAVLAIAQPPGTEERVAAIKQSLADSQVALRGYEWIETTVISRKGEEKSRKQERCYFDAEGKVEKVQENTQTTGKTPRGIRGKVAERKKEEVTDYMKQAVAKIQEYVPADPQRIQRVADAGNLSITPLSGGDRVRLDLHDYLQAGDLFALEFDLQTNNILSAKISSYIDSPDDTISLAVAFATLPDGTNHVSETNLDAPAKKVTVGVKSTGYRKTG